MVQIAEYTRREQTDPNSGRRPLPGNSIRLTEEITSGGRGAVTENLKALSRGGREIAGVMVDMKNRYDKAKSDEFILGYRQEAQKRILDYTQNRKGSLANGVSSDFQKWSDDYFAAATTKQDDTAPVRLENQEQIDMARKSLENVKFDYDTRVSVYEADEINKYEINMNTAMVHGYANDIATTNTGDFNSDMLTIANDIISLKGHLRDTYKGQSNEYIEMQARKAVSNSLVNNALSVVFNDPSQAAARLGLFQNNIEPELYAEAKKKLRDATVEVASTMIGKSRAYGNQTKPIEDYIDSSFWGEDSDSIKREIFKKSEEIMVSTIEEEKEATVNYKRQNYAGIEINDDSVVIPDNFKTAIQDTYRGADELNFLEGLRVSVNNQKYNLENGGGLEYPSAIQMETYNRYARRIRSGEIEVLSEFSDDEFFNSMTIDQKREIVGEFLNKVRIDEMAKRLKLDKGIDLKSIMKSNYETIGLKSDSPLYEYYEQDVYNQLAKTNMADIDQKKIGDIGRQVIQDHLYSNSDKAETFKVFKAYSDKNYANKSKTEADFRKDAVDVINNADLPDSINKEKLVEHLLFGDVDSFYQYVMAGKKMDEANAVAKEKLRKDILNVFDFLPNKPDKKNR